MTAKQPQDHKTKAEKAVEPHGPDEKFVFTSRDGSLTFTLPYLENLTRRQVKAVQGASQEDADEVLFELNANKLETLWNQVDTLAGKLNFPRERLEEAIGKAMEPFTEGDDPDVVMESHTHWAVGHVDGFSVRVHRDGEVLSEYARRRTSPSLRWKVRN
mgnify:CR=1 FL=1